MPEFSKPTIEYVELLPLFIVFGAACAGVLVEAFFPRERRRLPQLLVTLGGLVAALGATIWDATDVKEYAGGAARGLVGAEGSVIVDGPTLYLWGLILVFGILGTALFAERRLEGGLSAFAGQAAALPGTEAERQAATKGLDHTEVYPLLLFAIGGMLLFPASGDLLTMFVALEVLSLPLYLLCGLARRRRLLSQEAALKYFLLGAFSSGFFLYGAALVYGYAGSVSFVGIDQAVRENTADQGLLLAGIALLAVGLLFKVGAAPFQAWTPDVYQGAPTAVTAFMSAATKVAAFGALLRIFYVAFDGERWSWQLMLCGGRDRHDADRCRARRRPDRREADARLLRRRAHRLPADRRDRRPGGGAAGQGPVQLARGRDVLPHHLRLRVARRLRAGDGGP